jgi:hypothetical protein
LKTLETRDADADVSSLDHAHVVGTVTDGEQDSLLVLLDQFDHERLLKRRNAAWGNRRSINRQLSR